MFSLGFSLTVNRDTKKSSDQKNSREPRHERSGFLAFNWQSANKQTSEQLSTHLRLKQAATSLEQRRQPS